MLTLTAAMKWIEGFSEKILANKAYLSELDTPIGDGDHGNNMARGMEAVTEALAARQPESLPDLFKLIAMTLMSKVGGASGPLYGTAFMEMAKKSNETTDIQSLLQAGLDGIKRRGGAEVGDKTMVDAWSLVIEDLANNQFAHKTIDEAAQSTKDLQARRGRASYVGERSIGHLDPGAMSSSYLFHALLEAEESQ